LTEEQFGFRKNRDTNSCILNFFKNMELNIEDKYHTAVFIDLKKAFDTVNHRILISKLAHYGVNGQTLKWFENYLKDRKQRVSLIVKYQMKKNST